MTIEREWVIREVTVCCIRWMQYRMYRRMHEILNQNLDLFLCWRSNWIMLHITLFFPRSLTLASCSYLSSTYSRWLRYWLSSVSRQIGRFICGWKRSFQTLSQRKWMLCTRCLAFQILFTDCQNPNIHHWPQHLFGKGWRRWSKSQCIENSVVQRGLKLMGGCELSLYDYTGAMLRTSSRYFMPT